jgi:hypothetical protein
MELKPTCKVRGLHGGDYEENAVFWDVALCSSYVNRRFGGTYSLQLHGRKNRERGTKVGRWLRIFLP